MIITTTTGADVAWAAKVMGWELPRLEIDLLLPNPTIWATTNDMSVKIEMSRDEWLAFQAQLSSGGWAFTPPPNPQTARCSSPISSYELFTGDVRADDSHN